MAIVDVFHSRGKCAISDVAVALDVSPNSLYYHINMLSEVGLLVEDSSRKGKRRSETVYRLVRPRIEMVYDPRVEGSAESIARCAASMLRMTERDAKAALDRGDIIDDGPARNYHVGRGKVRLTEKGLERLNRIISQMEELLHREGKKKQGDTYAITMALIRLEPNGEDGQE
jgi:DNA-binding PadR family transcriptional regulator